MKIISVAGAHSNSGKTTVACMLLRGLPGWAALKVTHCRPDESCPRGIPCGTCETLDEPFRLVCDRETIAEPGKDTCRMLDAGASEVLWLQAKSSAMLEGLQTAFARLARHEGVVVEGNIVPALMRTDLLLMVVPGGSSGLKDSALSLLPRADALVILSDCPHSGREHVPPDTPTATPIWHVCLDPEQRQLDERELVRRVSERLGLGSPSNRRRYAEGGRGETAT